VPLLRAWQRIRVGLRERLINLVELDCYKCGEKIGSRTACYDIKTKTGKGWRHCDCNEEAK